MDRVGNDEVRWRAGIERELASVADQRVQRWFGHVERMDEYRMARGVAGGGHVKVEYEVERGQAGQMVRWTWATEE